MKERGIVTVFIFLIVVIISGYAIALCKILDAVRNYYGETGENILYFIIVICVTAFIKSLILLSKEEEEDE